MAVEHILLIDGQPYFNRKTSRTFHTFYTSPDKGITPSTGILLLISGFGADANSNVYQKMRHEFSDRADLVVIQCNYFGSEYMGSKVTEEIQSAFSELIQNPSDRQNSDDILPDKTIHIEQPESPDSFCELGIFQALDNLKSICYIINHIHQQHLEFDYNRIFAYGYSHGAYLALLCNAFMPNLFSAIIDNSAWLYPVYLYRPRMCSTRYVVPESNISDILFVMVHYQGRQWIDDMEIYNLRRLYMQFNNKTKIFSFHGEADGLVPPNEKKSFLKNTANTKLYIIQESDIDGILFKNTKHGMGSDFLKLFYHVSETEDLTRSSEHPASLTSLFTPQILSSKKYQYSVSKEIEISRKDLLP